MRLNEPITAIETEIPGDEPLVSRTDPAGRITFVNQVFVAVSGFAEQELIGAAQNIVRHPHMPAEVFANLWTPIKSGRPGAISARLRGISNNGATCGIGAEQTVPVGQTGRLILTSAGRASARFGVRSTGPAGVPHVRFADGAVAPAFAAITRLMKAPALVA